MIKIYYIYKVTQEHRLYHLKSKDEINKYGLDREWSLVLVDHVNGNTRAFNAIALVQKAKIVVVHDSEKVAENIYMFEKNNMTGYFNFKYVCKFNLFTKSKSGYVSTTLMSNFIDLETILTPAFKKVKTDYGHIPCDNSL